MTSETTANNPDSYAVVDLLDLTRSVPQGRPIWGQQSTDLNLNLLSLTSGQGIASHVNTEVDVLLIGIDGAGVLVIDGRQYPVRAGQAVHIPKGSQRAVQCGDHHFAYLTCHRRQVGLLPVTPQPRGDN